MNQDDVVSILKKILGYSKAEQTEAILAIGDSNATRFSNSYIHQNVNEYNIHLAVRTITNKKIGHVTTNTLDSKALKETVNMAMEISCSQKPDPDFSSLPQPAAIADKNDFFETTASCTPEKRAAVVAKLIKNTADKSLSAAGALTTTSSILGVANSLGVMAINKSTLAHLNLIVSSETSTGYASFLTADVNKINPVELADNASEKALIGQNPEPIKPGEYKVILEPEAVSDLVGWLGVSGFGAQSFEESRSFMSNQIGQPITGRNITIWDDANDKRTLGIPFDFEGVPKQKVTLIKHGIAKAVVYDSYTAHKSGKESTGHALPQPNTFGPLPLNLFMEKGDSTKEEMIASTKKGILVTRFHYTNIEHPIQTMLTGMTRDGTFLIENGKITKGLKNLRFTQNILEVLKNVKAISKQRELKRLFEFGTCFAPSIVINRFNFTGISQ